MLGVARQHSDANAVIEGELQMVKVGVMASTLSKFMLRCDYKDGSVLMVFFISGFQHPLKPEELYQTEQIDFCPL